MPVRCKIEGSQKSWHERQSSGRDYSNAWLYKWRPFQFHELRHETPHTLEVWRDNTSTGVHEWRYFIICRIFNKTTTRRTWHRQEISVALNVQISEFCQQSVVCSEYGSISQPFSRRLSTLHNNGFNARGTKRQQHFLVLHFNFAPKCVVVDQQKLNRVSFALSFNSFMKFLFVHASPGRGMGYKHEMASQTTPGRTLQMHPP